VNTTITVADTFIFVAILLYGPEAAILLAAAEGTCSGLRIKKKSPTSVLFNMGAIVCSTFLTSHTLHFILGSSSNFEQQSYSLTLISICTLALVQYLTHTGLVAVCLACKTDRPIWPTWTTHYLWSSITYFVGAFAAGGIVRFSGTVGFYAVIVTVPIILIVYLTYHKYLEDIRATSAQAEQAERQRAEQAERHVHELNGYIAELERTGRALKESKEHFRHAAFHDALTNLPNRALLADHLKFSIERAKLQPDNLFALLFFDLDRFKNVNDSLGHVAGDQLLVAIARRLEECSRPTDTVARLGGDEFAILVDGIEDYDHAIRLAERAQQKMRQPFNLNGHEVYATASIGITLCTNDYDDPEDILRDADTAMYRAKENGRARHEVFDVVMHTSAVARLQLENDLRRGLEREEFHVYYQPIVCLETENIAGFEALVRWEHPQRGFISPADFISIAEETGLIVELGLSVLREACRQTYEWQSLHQRSLIISVNLSSRQFTQPDLIEQISRILADTGLDPHNLKLEITESVVMENAETARKMLVQLRALGINLSIDDFGTGYSSLSYLHRFPLDTLKIDRSFISRMDAGDENAEIIRTILTLATNLGMDVVAEGLETEKQLAQLRDMKCGYGQGYLFSKPVNAEAARALILEARERQVMPNLVGDLVTTSASTLSYVN
jgi:diguanylate cyclase (GGDEF)-like protein